MSYSVKIEPSGHAFQVEGDETILEGALRQGVTLPERRVELYQKYVETLLKHWNLARGLDRPPSRDLDMVETVRGLAAERGALTAKTGTLTSTDGGIAVLAGFVRTAAGERLFAVAAPRSGRRPARARDALQGQMLAIAARSGGFVAAGCGSDGQSKRLDRADS